MTHNLLWFNHFIFGDPMPDLTAEQGDQGKQGDEGTQGKQGGQGATSK